MSAHIDYGNLMHQAMLDLVRTVLRNVERDGLPGKHHFFITVDTNHTGVAMPDWLRSRYPEEITVILQNWFTDLKVDGKGFAVTLSFSNQPEPIYVPFAAIRGFLDPSVEFNLRFVVTESQHAGNEAKPVEPDARPEPTTTEPQSDSGKGAKQIADVVSLDSFRR